MPQENEMGKRIKECRERLGLSQEELGKLIGKQKAAINKYESGQVENVKRETIKKLAKIFNVSPLWLMDLDDEVDEEFQTIYETDSLPVEKKALLEYFHKNPQIKVLFSITDDLTEEQLNYLIGLARTMKGE